MGTWACRYGWHRERLPEAWIYFQTANVFVLVIKAKVFKNVDV